MTDNNAATTTTPVVVDTKTAVQTKTNDDDDDRPPLSSSSKRRNLGRSARRRRKKVLEIEAAAEAATRNDNDATTKASTSTTTTTVVLATDRHYVWPAVKELAQLSKEEEQALAAQLGYLPGNALRVAATANKIIMNNNHNNHNNSNANNNNNDDDDDDEIDESPLVVELYPLVLRDESDSTNSRRKRKRTSEKNEPLVEPFPTTYWITHPRIRALISKLELDRWGQRIEERLQKEEESRISMREAHEAYAKKRYSLISEKDQAWIKERGWESAFAITRGVAGIRNPESVKCLHAHAAHFWSGCPQNVVGKWVAEEVARMLKPKTEETEIQN